MSTATHTIPTYLALELAASGLVDAIGEVSYTGSTPPEAAAGWERLADAVGDVCTALGHPHAAYQAREFLRPVLAETPDAVKAIEEGMIPAGDVEDLAVQLRALIIPPRETSAGTGDDLADLAHALRTLADEMGSAGGWKESITEITEAPDVDPIVERIKAAAVLVDETRDRIDALEAEVEELRERVGEGGAARGVLAALSQIRKLADDAARTFSTAADIDEDGGEP